LNYPVNKTLFLILSLSLTSAICKAQAYKITEGEGFNSHVFVGEPMDTLNTIFQFKLDSVKCLQCQALFSQEKPYKFTDISEGIEITLTDSTNTINRIKFSKNNFISSSGIHIGSSKTEVLKQYGSPEKMSKDFQDNSNKFYYPKQGISIGFRQDTLVNVTIFPKDSLVYRELPSGFRKPYLAARDSFSAEGLVLDFIWSAGQEGTDSREGILVKITSSTQHIPDTIIVNKLANAEEHYNRGKRYRLTITPTRPFYGGDFTWTTYMKYEKYKYYCFSIKQLE
jgi:hypothetical protein